MEKIIHLAVTLHCDTQRAFELFTLNSFLESWLVPSSDVDPVTGGRYHLFWDPSERDHDSTLGCSITAIEPGKFLSFEWKGPRQFESFMNAADPLTHVAVFFLPCGAGATPWTEVHLLHSGWRSGEEWDEARSWFEQAWAGAFDKLHRQFPQ